MSTQHRLPLQNMTSREWLNLALAGLILFYAIYMIWQIVLRMMCGQIGVDFCDYVSAGRVANTYGYAGIYNLQLLEQVQRSILSAAGNSSSFPVLPFRYLPVFVPPAQLLSHLSPASGYWIFTALNVAVLFFYLQFFIRSLRLPPAPARLMLMIFACLPVFMNIFDGQMDVLLAICVGEFTRAFLGKRSFRAGLWLGGLLLKPQVLILIGVILLLQRSWRILAGLAISSFAFAIASFLLVGQAGLVQMLKVWLSATDSQANVWVEGMMNWRMLGVHLSNVTNPWVGWGIAGAGMLATAAITLFVWRHPFDPDPSQVVIALLGILAATALVTWHSHIHMAVMLIPPIIYLYQAKVLPQKVLDYWVFLPAFVFLIMVFGPETMMQLNMFSGDIRPFINFFIGASEFSVNLYLLWWAVGASRQRR